MCSRNLAYRLIRMSRTRPSPTWATANIVIAGQLDFARRDDSHGQNGCEERRILLRSKSYRLKEKRKAAVLRTEETTLDARTIQGILG
jgi:hypothetical protein